MTFFDYNQNLPTPPHPPPADVGGMQINSQSNYGIWNIDHFGFQNNLGGTHQQVTLFNRSAPGFGSSSAVLYANVADGQSWPFWQNAVGSFQLGGTVTSGNLALFATNTMYQAAAPPKPAVTGGFTYLPGGMILQYGTATSANLNANYEILFPIPFLTFVGSVTLGPIRSDTEDKTISIFDESITLTGFQLELSSGDLPTGVCWMAIGV